MNKYRVLERDGLFYVQVEYIKIVKTICVPRHVSVWKFSDTNGHPYHDNFLGCKLTERLKPFKTLKKAWNKIKQFKTPPKKIVDIIHTEEQL